MTLTISPETEEKITSQARARGLSADEFATEILERGIATIDPPITVRRMSAEEFLAKGPARPNAEPGWPAEFYGDRDDRPTYRLPKDRPTADQFTAALESIASTDRPARDYPEDFFSREVIYGNQD
jgi:hypothetical protein